MEFILIEQDSPEWQYIWKWLEFHPINEGIPDPSTALNEGEAWQYTGSYRQDYKVIHCLRHRNHPRTNARMDLALNASEGFTSSQIKKAIKM